MSYPLLAWARTRPQVPHSMQCLECFSAKNKTEKHLFVPNVHFSLLGKTKLLPLLLQQRSAQGLLTALLPPLLQRLSQDRPLNHQLLTLGYNRDPLLELMVRNCPTKIALINRGKKQNTHTDTFPDVGNFPLKEKHATFFVNKQRKFGSSLFYLQVWDSTLFSKL